MDSPKAIKDRPMRMQFDSRVRLAVAGQNDMIVRFAQSLSEGGMFVRDDTPAAVGSRVLVEFLLPDGKPLCRLTAEVVHARPAMVPGENTAGMGLKFVEYDDDAKALRASLSQAAPKDEPQARAPGIAEPDQPPMRAPAPETLNVPGPPPLLALKGPVVGIDLGTSNSSIAIVEGGRPRVIASDRGYEAVPSVVFVGEDGKISVGHKAVERMILAPSRAVYGAKRFLGRPYASREVRTLGHFFAYELVEGPKGLAAAKVGDVVLPLEIVAAHILRELGEMARHHLGEEVHRAVITVPAYFGESQRQAVREAGRLAGFYVERLINEPTAAAVAFGYDRGMARTVLVYDLGGGTFDASILRIDGNEFVVLASDGDPFLGGTDFDDRLTEYALMTFERQHQLNLHNDIVAVQRLRFAAEVAKRQLSEAMTALIDLPYIASAKTGYLDLRMTFEREVLESLTQDLVDRTLNIVQSVLDQAGIGSKELDDVLLVGGQSRSPQVRRLVVERFGKQPSKAVHPDEAVALGASIVADWVRSNRPVLLTDLLPASIRIGAPDGLTTVLLPRGARLPAGTHVEVSPQGRSSAPMSVQLYRGEAERADENTFLGAIRFAPIASSAAVTAKVKVTVNVAADGLLSVSARHPLTGEVKELDVSLVEADGAVS